MPRTTTRATTRATQRPTGQPRGGGAAQVVDAPVDEFVNLAVLCGPCSAPPEVRVLESGSRLATLAVRCPVADGRATSVPVTVWDPPAWLDGVGAGDELVVVGRLRRRFYQRPGGVGSRVDVEAELVGRARDRRRVATALQRARRALEVLE